MSNPPSKSPPPDAPQRIEPRTLKGFRDYLPEAMIPRERLIDTARRVYRSYGFSPIDTPALEYLEILAGKGGEETDKQLYKLPGPRRPLGGAAVRPDGAAGPLRRAAHRRAGHAVQALSHRHGLARREHAARPLPRVHAVRFRHDRHAVARRRHRNGPGDPRPAARPSASTRFRIRVNNRMVLTGLLGAARAGGPRGARAAGARQARQRSARRKWPRKWPPPPAPRPQQATRCCGMADARGRQRRSAGGP